jgi:CheY-like chemotaxis protein
MIAESDLHTAKLNGLRILLVEDEAMVAMLVEGMLTALGCQVVEWVANIPAALNAIDTIEFDGALLDMNLSGAVVFPVAEVLAARGLPFVFVTGYGRTAEAAARFPAAPVLKKPFDSSQLARILKQEIAMREEGRARE